jgi:hypothetical protein
LTAISPTMAQAWRNDTMVLTGTNLTGVTSVYVGTKLLSTTGTPGFRVINDSRIEFDTFVPPTMQPVAVSAEGPGGKSNGLVLFYQPTSPPRLDVQSTILPTQFLVWEFSGGVNNSFFLTAGATGTTFKLFGFDWLLNPAILTTGTVNAVGFGLIYVQVPANVGKGLKVFSQVVMADFQQGVISGTTNVASTTVQ